MKEEMISVVIPIYNTEKYLERCIDSVCEQTYNNLEIILINDGSTDKTEEICLKFSEKDNRIKYFYKKNEGVSIARNMGIKEATGKFLYFLDSDDWIEKNCIEELYKNISNYELSFCLHSKNKKSNFEFVINKKEFLENLFYPSKYEYQGYIWNKLFEVEIIKKNKIFFEEKIKYNEDRLFVFKYIQKMKTNIKFVDKILYHYEYREESAMNREFNEKMLTEFEAFEKMIECADKDSRIIKKIKCEIFNTSIYRYIDFRNEAFRKYITIENFLGIIFENSNLECKFISIKNYIKYIIFYTYLKIIKKFKL